MAAPTAILAQPELTESPRRFVLYCRREAAQADLAVTLGQAFAELYGHIGREHAEPDGPPFVIYHGESQPGVRWVVDVCAPVLAPITPAGDLRFMDMPTGRVVSLLHTGPYETLGEAYAQVERFVAKHGLIETGPPREIYLSEPDVAPAQIQTVIEQPVRD